MSDKLRHLGMILAWGKTPGRKCRECGRLRRREQGKVFHKCSLYGDSGGPATDWHKNWDACGAFTPERNPPPPDYKNRLAGG